MGAAAARAQARAGRSITAESATAWFTTPYRTTCLLRRRRAVAGLHDPMSPSRRGSPRGACQRQRLLTATILPLVPHDQDHARVENRRIRPGNDPDQQR